jgi:glycine/D-amino acid oxidase-like deaminating enzyme
MSGDAMGERYCVIGAGPSGLAALRNFLARGIPVVGFEREDDVGGNWYFGKPSSSVSRSTHLISSKRMTEFPGFPMPKDYPPYPSHSQAFDYLRAFAEQFRLYDHLCLRTAVTRVEPAPGGGWLVATDDGAAPRRFRGVVVANGHHWDPVWPSLPGEFSGQYMHAKDFKSPECLAGRRVLVVGAGNSGCDIAVEAAQHAASATMSLRRGYHFLPKFLLGTPIDTGGDWLRRHGVPLWLIRWWTQLLVRIAVGRPERYGLPRPDHRLFETHPIVNSQLLYQVGHGRVRIRPAIEELRGDRVRFVDGTEEPFDVIVCATGYRVRFPFVAPGVLAGRPVRPTAEQEDDVPELYLHAFHPLRDDFFVAGMIQPNSGLWPLADDQTRLMAAFVAATAVDSPASRWFRRLKAGQNPDLSGGLSFDRSPRHRLEVEYYSYRRRLRKLLARFDREQPPRPVPAPVADTTPAASRFDAWAPQPANRLRGENV